MTRSMPKLNTTALHPWRVLTLSVKSKIDLRMTLCGGQCFHWYPTPRHTFVGVIGHDVFELREVQCAAKRKKEKLQTVPSQPPVSTRATPQREPGSTPPSSAAAIGDSSRPSCCWIEYRRLWPLADPGRHDDKSRTTPPSSSLRFAGASSASTLGESDEEMLSRYLSLDVDLDGLWQDWTQSPQTRQHPLVGYLVGNRLQLQSSRGDDSQQVCKHDQAQASLYIAIRHLRQDLHSCLFSFLCSQNNNVTRITGMVYKLCRAYGDHLCDVHLTTGEVRARRKWGVDTSSMTTAEGFPSSATIHDDGVIATPSLKPQNSRSTPPEWLSMYSFPSIEQLSTATEDALRALGFGYRSKYVVDAVSIIRSQSPTLYLQNKEVRREQVHPPPHLLRQHGACYQNGFYSAVLSRHGHHHRHQREMLQRLPGVGRKVADCVALFSLNRTHIVPVDTHMAQVAVEYLVPPSSVRPVSRKRCRTRRALSDEECAPWEDVLLEWRKQAETLKKRNVASPGSGQAIGKNGDSAPVARRASEKSAFPALYERHHSAIQDAFCQLFGNYAGWAHSILFYYQMRK
ncbi:hypothetical protein JIQ42_01544 [Leishmania sp. Namibia]|uniref:hypothetical protein n=1 Tax=Leishmania sp. Namibia TaxID=2802991 RepID=UPI001B5D5904|nr:hypothetical protein JIQ42_01544 [Leishmania sp. Namibia]